MIRRSCSRKALGLVALAAALVSRSAAFGAQGDQGDQVQEARPHHTHRAPPSAATPAAPRSMSLGIAAADSPLALYTILDGATPSTVSGNVTLIMTGAPTAVPRLRAMDLPAIGDPALRIDRGDISIPAGAVLTSDEPYSLRITVHNIPRPGTYTGHLTLYLAEQTSTTAELPITVHATARPQVASVQTALTQRLVVCSDRVSCWLAARILPESAITDEVLVLLDNKTSEPVELSGAALMLRGERSGALVAQSILTPVPPLPRQLPAGRISELRLALNRNQLAPEHYQGTLRLDIKGGESLQIALDVSVRHGPVLPLLILLLGIAMGRLVQKIDTPEIKKQLRLLDRHAELADRAEEITHPAAQQLVHRHLARIRAQIESGRESEEALQLASDQVLSLIDLLINIEALEKLAAGLADPARTQVLRAGIAARQLLATNQFAQAEEQRQAMEALLVGDHAGTAAPGGPTPVPVFDGARHLELLQTTAQAVADGGWRRIKAALRFLSGLSTNSANARYWLARPLLSVALLLLLSLLGLQQLYVSAGTTFGSTGLYDYLGLLVWGLSADIAQRSVQTLPGLPAR
jgi:hypothetical protein